ncbi:MAG: hypothetical protein HYS13_24160 [Planctomycetia bacterium]|nr:hypothetical protein [Planctomycetia bacterium]
MVARNRGSSTAERAHEGAAALLAAHFEACGYVRLPNQTRRLSERRNYKKGWEVRLPATTHRELQFLRRVLKACGFKCGRAFRKRAGWILPLYGQAAVERFRNLVRTHRSAAAGRGRFPT